MTTNYLKNENCKTMTLFISIVMTSKMKFAKLWCYVQKLNTKLDLLMTSNDWNILIYLFIYLYQRTLYLISYWPLMTTNDHKWPQKWKLQNYDFMYIYCNDLKNEICKTMTLCTKTSQNYGFMKILYLNHENCDIWTNYGKHICTFYVLQY